MRVYGDKTMEDWQMQNLAKTLRQAGFTTAAVGKNYIEFYSKVEIRRLAEAVLHERGGEEVPAPGAASGER